LDLLPNLHAWMFGSTLQADVGGSASRALLLGHVLWILAYGLILARSHRDQLIGIPLAAIFLNITWEALVYSNCAGIGMPQLCGPGLTGEWSLALAIVLALDVLLLVQAFVLTCARIGTLRTTAIFVISLALLYALHGNFLTATLDYRGLVDSWIINLLMSVLFVRLALSRPQGEGLSLLAGIAKGIGSLMVTIGLWIAPEPYAMSGVRAGIVYGLAAAVFIADLCYVTLLWRRQLVADRTG
jgi:hypothetical protein